jgi:rare lipoprotein A
MCGFLCHIAPRFIAGCLLFSASAAAQEPVSIRQGTASYYRSDFRGTTASGEAYHPELFTAAHASLPLGTWVKVTNSRTGQSVLVRINDRSPFVAGNLIDVSRAAAEKLDLLREGYAEVSVAVLPAAPNGEVTSTTAPSAPKPAPSTATAPSNLRPVSGELPPAARSAKTPAGPIRPVLRVQFGAFHDLDSASQTQVELRDLGVETVIYRRENPQPGEPLYRLVTSGGFAEQSAADRWLEYMKRKTGRYPDAYVTN